MGFFVRNRVVGNGSSFSTSDIYPVVHEKLDKVIQWLTLVLPQIILRVCGGPLHCCRPTGLADVSACTPRLVSAHRKHLKSTIKQKNHLIGCCIMSFQQLAVIWSCLIMRNGICNSTNETKNRSCRRSNVSLVCLWSLFLTFYTRPKTGSPV